MPDEPFSASMLRPPLAAQVLSNNWLPEANTTDNGWFYHSRVADIGPHVVKNVTDENVRGCLCGRAGLVLTAPAPIATLKRAVTLG